MNEEHKFAVVDLARLAAFVDGEGTITIKRYRQRARNGSWAERTELKLAITNTDVRLLAWCKQTFDMGCVYVSDSRASFRGQKKAFRWEIGARSAERLLRAMYPYLILKQEQAQIAFAFQDLLGVPGKRTDGRDWNRRLELVQDMKTLNQRGLHQQPTAISG